tara:strand:- start:595 stop:1155 length:561 start_codon:yes stop_codon:yes gene_type:complete
MDYINQTKTDIQNALAEFIKLKTNKSEEEVINLSKKFLDQIDEKLSNNTSTKEIFKHLQQVEHGQPIYLNGINFVSLCEHHLLPFFGTVDIALYPQKKIAGISRFDDLVRHLSDNLTLQETLTKNIATEIEEVLNPRGVFVRTSANHSCSGLLNVGDSFTDIITTFSTGIYEIDHTLRNEALLNFK